jgi:hypothetical protein
MRAIFWPTRPNPNPTAITRLGRVLHWIACGIAGLFVLVMFAAATNGDSLQSNIYGIVLCAFWAVVFFLAGRVLRYVLSAE